MISILLNYFVIFVVTGAQKCDWCASYLFDTGSLSNMRMFAFYMVQTLFSFQMRLFFLLSSYSLSYCINESAYFTEISHLIRLAQHGYMFGHGISTSLLIYLFPTSVFGAGCFSFFRLRLFLIFAYYPYKAIAIHSHKTITFSWLTCKLRSINSTKHFYTIHVKLSRDDGS